MSTEELHPELIFTLQNALKKPTYFQLLVTDDLAHEGYVGTEAIFQNKPTLEKLKEIFSEYKFSDVINPIEGLLERSQYNEDKKSELWVGADIEIFEYNSYQLVERYYD